MKRAEMGSMETGKRAVEDAKAEAADLFPRTHHVESVCLLVKE